MTIILDESPGLLGVTGNAWLLSLESRYLIKMLDFFGWVSLFGLVIRLDESSKEFSVFRHRIQIP